MVPFWKEALEMVLDVEPGECGRERGGAWGWLEYGCTGWRARLLYACSTVR